MDLAKISELMRQFEDSDMRELQIDEGDFHLYLSKNKLNHVSKTVSENAPVESASKTTKPAAKISVEKAQPADDANSVKAPIVGIVYLQAKPGQPSFVKVGDHVKKGQTICIIEAMKMMTEVKSDVSGIVTSIEVENEDLVEVDQPLIKVKED